MKRSLLRNLIASTVCAAVYLPSTAVADDLAELKALKKRVEALEAKLLKQSEEAEAKNAILAKEIEKNKLNTILPEKAELKSEWGFGPAASSVYGVKQGLSIGGYGEGTYRSFVEDDKGKKDIADMLRLITYFGYKFDDDIIFNSEIEFEHGTTGEIGDVSGESGGEVSVEFAYLDFMHEKAFNTRAGLVLVPMGLANEMHEPVYFNGVRRPEVEQVILPSTWRELGFGFFGEGDAAGKLEYRTYLLNGLRASRFSDTGIRNGRQKGNQSLVEDVAWTGRLDYSPDAISGLTVGGSFWLGKSGQGEEFAGETPDVFTGIGSAHAVYKKNQLELKALGAWGSIDDADILSTAAEKTIGDEFNGWYGEVAYDILPHLVSGTSQSLSPFFRYEEFDTHAGVPSGFERNRSLDKQVFVYGVTYKPIDKVVLKLDYRNFETDGDSKTADEVAVGIGFVF